MTPVATWCVVVIVVVLGLWAIHEWSPAAPEPDPMVDDHEWEEHPEDPDVCAYWYVDNMDQQPEPCPYTFKQHVEVDDGWDDTIYEDDMCPGHPTVTGGWTYCGLPFGHKGMDEVSDDDYL